MHVYIEICFKKLAHALMDTSALKICRAGWQAGDPGKSWYCSSVRSQSASRILAQAKSAFFLLRPSSDQMSPTDIMKGYVLYKESTDFNVNFT